MALQQPYKVYFKGRHRIIHQVHHHPLSDMGMLASYYNINQALGIAVDIGRDGSYAISCCQVLASMNAPSI